MGGRIVTAARSKAPIGIDRLVGRTIASVEPNGKHLLMHFVEPDAARALVLQTHMRMSGSWHVYESGVVWKRPRRQATLVVEAGERVAVGFNIPIVSLDSETWMRSTPALRLLGSDILSAAFDLDDVLRRLAAQPAERAIGEVLLDQTIVAGIGNIYRCESLFLCRHNPWKAVGALTEEQRRDLIVVAQTLMRANLGADVGRDFGQGQNKSNVYRRTGRPCRVCATPIRSEVQGTQARRAYWCPACQP
jgi:endonuclease VIII